MYTEVYIDVIFLMNFLMDYILLGLIGRFFYLSKKRIRYVIASAAGALFSSIVFVLPWEIGNAAGILMHGFCGILMLRIGLGIRRSGLLMQTMVCLYLVAFLFGGFVEAVFGNGTYTPVAFLILAFGFDLLLSGLHLASDCFRTRMRNLYSVTLIYGRKKCDACGFYDTGNLLCDPLTGKPVSVLSADLLPALLSPKILEDLKYIMGNPGELENTDLLQLKPHFLSFHSVGEKEGLLVAITLDELRIHTPMEERCIAKPVFALHMGPSALGNEYEVLLNSRLL